MTAEETRATAAEKARLAEQEKARLAAEGAKQAELAKAVAAAKAAEMARIAAEKAKQVEQEKAAVAEQARLAAERAAGENRQQLAALPPSSEKQEVSHTDVARALQAELRRVGCNTGAVDGNWSDASQKALDLFNKHAGIRLDVKTASADALDAVKTKSGRICPLVCATGYRADGERCAKIACRAGYQPGHDGTCEKIEVRKPAAKREQGDLGAPNAAAPKPQVSGQILCDLQGCRPVRKGCRLVGRDSTGGIASQQREVCN